MLGFLLLAPWLFAAGPVRRQTKEMHCHSAVCATWARKNDGHGVLQDAIRARLIAYCDSPAEQVKPP